MDTIKVSSSFLFFLSFSAQLLFHFLYSGKGFFKVCNWLKIDMFSYRVDGFKISRGWSVSRICCTVSNLKGQVLDGL